MSAQFFFSLLNPTVAVVLTATFVALWRLRPSQTYLAALGLAFFCSGLAFAINDFMQPFEAPVLRISANLLFLIAVLSACIGALTRVGARVPFGLFGGTILVMSGAFVWYLLVEPSVVARIYAVNAGYAVLATVTVQSLLRARPTSIIDWLFVMLAFSIGSLAVIRPVAMVFMGLDINLGGTLRDSSYWVTIQALSPVLAMVLALLFLLALGIQAQKELQDAADRDYLTGLLNRRGFENGARKALELESRIEWQPALMMIDIDDFKSINDRFGHVVGDAVISAVGQVLAEHGGADLAARAGGEEFALFYRNGRRADLLNRAEVIRGELGRVRLAHLPPHVQVTVSIGIHTRHQSETVSDMMVEADRALYAAKRTGKDRAVMAPPMRPVSAATL